MGAIEARLETIIESLLVLPDMKTDIAATKNRVDAMGEMFEVYLTVKETGKRTGRFVLWLGRAVKWLGTLAVAIAAILVTAKAFAWESIR